MWAKIGRNRRPCCPLAVFRGAVDLHPASCVILLPTWTPSIISKDEEGRMTAIASASDVPPQTAGRHAVDLPEGRVHKWALVAICAVAGILYVVSIGAA